MEDFTYKIQDVADCLRVSVSTINRLLRRGAITPADGYIKVGSQNRFIRNVVLARILAGLFAKGLDAEGKPLPRPKLRAA
jgi:hypothetical protein